MKANDNFIQTCLYWHTEISIYRSRINQIRKKLQLLKPAVGSNGTYQKFASIAGLIHDALSLLRGTERSVVCVIQENLNCAPHPQFVGVKSTLSSEDELFEEMISCYTIYMKVQRAFNQYVKESSAPANKTKIIEFPFTRRVQKKALNPAEGSLYLDKDLRELNQA